MRNWSVPHLYIYSWWRSLESFYTTSQNACVVSGNFVLLCERWCSGVTAVQPHGRRKYLRTACRRFEYLDELSPPGTFTVTVLYRLLEIIYFFTTLYSGTRSDITLSLYIYTQADVCHAYQILHRHGVPDENVVVMMYNDIAHNSEWVLYHR